MVEDLETPSKNMVVTGEKLEALLEKEREKYIKIINHLTDKIKEAGCDLEHPFDRESMTVRNTYSEELNNKIERLKSSLRMFRKQHPHIKESEFMYLSATLEDEK